MILLLFSFISGLVTILAPCIWPLLPIVLSSSVKGGRNKALGISLGVALSFAFFTLTISYIVKVLPIGADLFRFLAVLVIGFLGFTLIIPALSRLVEGWVSRLSGAFGSKVKISGEGFGGGFLTGLSLGVVWSPCAGPILATIAALAATRSVSGQLVLITLMYSLGVSIPLFLFSLLGSRLFSKVRGVSKNTHIIQRTFGVIMIITAFLILTNQDKTLEISLLNLFPSYSNALTAIETTPQVTGALSGLKGGGSGLSLAGSPLTPMDEAPKSQNASSLPNLGKAPDFIGITSWLNLPDGKKSLSLADLKGKVVLVDFWTYTCINCIRTLPFVTSWYDKYASQGFVVVGVHTPEFEFEKETPNVENAIKQFHIHYPVAQDNDYVTWNNYSNEYWPAEYLIDAQGNIRHTHFGEGEYDQTEKAIQALLKEKGASVSGALVTMKDQTPTEEQSPESYLGSNRMEFLYPQGHIDPGNQTLTLNNDIPESSFSFGGEWNITGEQAISEKDAVLNYHFVGNKVFLVLQPGSNRTATMRVMIDGKVPDSSSAGADVKDGVVTIDQDRLYNLIDLKGNAGSHLLHLEFDTPGTQAYAFTFG